MSGPLDEVTILNAGQIARTLTRMAHEILERNPDEPALAIVGIHTRGAFLARRLHEQLATLSARDLPIGELDITFYRDDVGTRGVGEIRETPHPVVKGTDIPFEIDDSVIVLVDDVLYTGRTIRAAIDALFDFGRPKAIQLAVLVDRGHRELPIRPDFVGKNMPTALPEHVSVRLSEYDGQDEVVLERGLGEERS